MQPPSSPRAGRCLHACLAGVLVALCPAAAYAVTPIGYLDGAGCEGISGWSQDPDEPDKPIDVHIYIGGPAGSANAVAYATNAGVHRDDLCTAIGSCAHGFVTLSPLSLHDGQPREVYAYGIDSQGGPNPLLGSSPKVLSCAPAAPAAGIKRKVDGVGTFDAWRFSSFWDLLPLGAAEADVVPEGPALPAVPELWSAEGGTPPGLWLIDGGVRRAVSDQVAATWRLDPAAAEAHPAADFEDVLEGTPLPARPVIFIGGGLYLLDDPQPGGDSSSSSSGAGTSGGSTGAGGAGGSIDGGDPADPTDNDAFGNTADSSCAIDARPVGVARWWLAMIALAFSTMLTRHARRPMPRADRPRRSPRR